MSVQGYVYPNAFEQYEVNADLVNRAKEGRIGLQLFPDAPKDVFEVRWWQKDNAYGLMQIRGLDGRPAYVERLGMNQFVHKPGVYGEYTTITETELLTRAAPLTPNQMMDVTALTTDATNLLAQRQEDRKEANVWTLIGTGTLSINGPGPQGPPLYSVTFPIQTYIAPVSWATLSTAAPIVNLQTIQQKAVGHGTKFDATSTMYMNQVTANRLINNSNTADFGGRRDSFGATINNIEGFASYFQAQNLPKLVVYDEGYQNQQVAGPISNAATQFTKFISDGLVIIVGKRPNNEPLGHVHICPSANNPGNAAGPYSFIKNYGLGINAPKEVPARLEVHAGWSGGLALEYPSGVVAMSV